MAWVIKTKEWTVSHFQRKIGADKKYLRGGKIKAQAWEGQTSDGELSAESTDRRDAKEFRGVKGWQIKYVWRIP